MILHPLHRSFGVGHLVVDLAAARVSRLAVADQAGQRLARSLISAATNSQGIMPLSQ